MTRSFNNEAPGLAQGASLMDIHSLLVHQAGIRADAVAIRSADGPDITYRQLADHVASLALRLQNARCIPEGRRPRIGLVMPNGTTMATSLLSAAVAGTALPFNPSCAAAEFGSYFSATSLDLLLVDGEGIPAAIEAAATLSLPVLDLSDLKRQDPGSARLKPPSPNDTALVLMTSGSTGSPKSVPLTHLNICYSTAEVCRSVELTSADICLSMWEQYHIGGLVDLLLAPLASGGMVYTTSGFSAERFFELLDQIKPTWFQGVPTTLGELIHFAREHRKPTHNSSLRFIRAVASALSAEKKLELEIMFQVPVVRTFGMTEAGPLITSTRLVLAEDKPTSLGLPCGCEVKILDLENNLLGPGLEGQVFIRGINVFAGYENDPNANRDHFLDGWFNSGDLGYLDQEGELFLTGRTKQLINRGGEKINPVEVESVLATHPSILDAAVFPVPHRTLGEEIVAAIVSDSPPSTSELQDFLNFRLSIFKIPKAFHLVDRLPINDIGKVDRRALSSRFSTANQSFNPQGTPNDDLERFLSVVWAAELDVKTIGTLDDFSALGGDSLAALRIIVTVEKSLGSDLGGMLGKNLTTIRDLASVLRRDRLVPEVIPDAPAEIKEPLAEGQKSLADLRENYRLVSPLTHVSQAKEMHESMVSFSTPGELRDLLGSTSIFSGVSLGRCLSPATYFKWAFWRRILWRLNIRRALRRAPKHALSWEKSEISNNVIHYHSAEGKRNTKGLIVGFTGHSQRLMMPAYLILNHLDPGKFDLLLLLDPGRNHYANGVPGVCRDLGSIASFTADFIRDQGYLHAISLGTSGGGIASAWVALENRWTKAVVVGADDPHRHPLLHQKLKELSCSNDCPTAVSMHYASVNDRDRSAAEALHSLVPGSVLKPNSGIGTHLKFGSHVLLYRLYLRRELAGFFESELTHPPEPILLDEGSRNGG